VETYNTQPTSDYAEKQQELNKNLSEQVASHASMIEELSKSISSIGSDIQSLQLQSTGLDKALSKLAANEATLLSMSAVKPHASPMVGMNSIVVSKILPTTFEET
jgi:chromosome segregation ATPase